ncbi:MAG: RtcB family protein, partial [Acidobacteriota bacterium]
MTLDMSALPHGPVRARALEAWEQATDRKAFVAELRDVVARAEDYVDATGLLGELAQAVLASRPRFVERDAPAPFEQWGVDLDEASLQQMREACRLPVAVRGAVMPDAHRGYGLPIGGVLATRGTVIPYAVGVDIACRMKMTVLDVPVSALDEDEERLIGALRRETRFGIGAKFRQRHEHDVMDRDWSVSPVTEKFKDKAWAPLEPSCA